MQAVLQLAHHYCVQCCGGADGVIHQRWFDDPDSLRLKYAVAKDLGLRGVGPFCYGIEALRFALSQLIPQAEMSVQRR
jgi:hypothetical protein